MFGRFLSEVVDVVTTPVRAVNAAVDIVTGGNGSKESRRELPTPLTLIEEVAEVVSDELKDLDD